MKKIIAIISILLLLLTLTACKKYEEQTASPQSLPKADSEREEPLPESDEHQTDTKTPEVEDTPKEQNTPVPESNIKDQKPDKTDNLADAAEQQPPGKSNLPEATVEDLKSAIVLSVEKDNKIYYNGIDNVIMMSPWSYVYPYDDIDRSLLTKTDEKITVYLEGYTPVDSVVAFAKASATVYELPEEVRNNPAVNVIALKPDVSDEILIFSTVNSWTRDYSLGAYIAKRCRGLLKDTDKISEIVIRKIGPAAKEVTVSASEDIKNIFKKIRNYQFAEDNSKPSTGGANYSLQFHFENGTSLKLDYHSASGVLGIPIFTCKADADFAEFLDSYL